MRFSLRVAWPEGRRASRYRLNLAVALVQLVPDEVDAVIVSLVKPPFARKVKTTRYLLNLAGCR